MKRATSKQAKRPATKAGKRKKPALKPRSDAPRVSTALMYNSISKPRSEQLDILDAMKSDQATHKQLKLENIDEVGANLSTPGWLALMAVTRLAGMQGRYYEADKQRKVSGLVRPDDILVSQNDFFAAYGLQRVPNSKGEMRYSRRGREDALLGLAELARPVVQVYTRKASSGKAGRKDVVQAVAPLATYARLELDATTKRVKEITSGDIAGSGHSNAVVHWRITPSEIFYLSSFMQLPDTLFKRLQALDGKRTLTPALCKQAIVLALHVHHYPGEKTYSKQLDSFLSATGKNKLLESRQRNRAVKETGRDLDKLKQAGAVTKHRVIDDAAKGKIIEIDVVPEAFN